MIFTTDFGCVQSFEYLNKNYSCHYLNMAYRINNLSKNFDFKNIKKYFEIGGGFGSNIHFLITNFPNIKKILYLDSKKSKNFKCWYRIFKKRKSKRLS